MDIKMNDGEYDDDDDISLNDSVDFDSDVHLSDNYDDLSSEEEAKVEVQQMEGVANAMNKILSSKGRGRITILSKSKRKDEKLKVKLGDDESDLDEEKIKRRKMNRINVGFIL